MKQKPNKNPCFKPFLGVIMWFLSPFITITSSIHLGRCRENSTPAASSNLNLPRKLATFDGQVTRSQHRWRSQSLRGFPSDMMWHGTCFTPALRKWKGNTGWVIPPTSSRDHNHHFDPNKHPFSDGIFFGQIGRRCDIWKFRIASLIYGTSERSILPTWIGWFVW